MRYVEVRNWTRFQHYRHRNPPWIKLHHLLLDDYDWITWDAGTKLLAVATMLIAARTENCIPWDRRYIEKVAHISVAGKSMTCLIDCKWVVPIASTLLANASNLHTNACSETETETEKNIVPTELTRVETRGEAVERVFDHWRETWKHPGAQLDAKRRRVIANALKGYSEADLRSAISGYLNSPHHCGINDRETVYDEIGLLLRDAAHIDAGLAFGQERTTGPAKSDLRFYSADEHKAYQAAVAQGRSFSDQAAWEAYRDGQSKTH